MEEKRNRSGGATLQPHTPGWAPSGRVASAAGGEVSPGGGDGEEGSACCSLTSPNMQSANCGTIPEEPHMLL